MSTRRRSTKQRSGYESTAGPSRVRAPLVADMLDEPTQRILRSYLEAVRTLPNESAKTHRFIALAGELFRGTPVSTELSAGVEKLVRIDLGAGTKRGRIDSYYGNAVIEFENSLKATESVARRQLREYTAGLWANEPRPPRPLLCVATDGLTWKSFLPRLSREDARRITPEDVELEPLRTIGLSEDTLGEFWLWLTSLLFRPERSRPTAERFTMDFGGSSPAYADAMDVLVDVWAASSGLPEARVKLEEWRKCLAITYGRLGSDLEPLFLKHTYLASVARLLVWASLSKGRTRTTLRETAREVLSGRFFHALRIENLVEEDFFHWVLLDEVEPFLAPTWERMLSQMQTYDLGRLDQDVMKGVYQELVDPKDRHDLGEYYTPEWLCERTVAEVLPSEGWARVCDPTCGSGSFLRAAIAHLLRANAEEEEAVRLQGILDNVVGIDIHPLAVTIARATYVLAIRDLVKAAPRPVHIPVYLADSLFLPAEVRQLTLGALPSYEIRLGTRRRVQIPEVLVDTPEFFDAAVSAATKVARDHVRSGRESAASLRAYLQKAAPSLSEHSQSEAMSAALWSLATELAGLMRERKNSIWSFILRNSYRPAMLRDSFEYIVGNPPWLSYRYIDDPEYQAEVKRRAVEDYGVAPKLRKLMTQMELATVFLVHALSTFGKEGARLGFVMPRSLITADQHATFRTQTYVAPVRLDGYWDLAEVEPIFRVPSCVFFATKKSGHQQGAAALPALEWRGHLDRRDVPWAVAEGQLSQKSQTARIIYLGGRTAFSTKAGRSKPGQASAYESRFRQGATIVPRNFYFVRVRDFEGRTNLDRVCWAETDPGQAEDAKPPYKSVYMKGNVEGRFFFSTALSKHLLPFVLLPPATVVLPLDVTDGRIEVLTADRMRASGYREFAAWMEEAERIWAAKRKRKAGRQTVYDRLDYQGELTDQRLSDRYLVLYNAAGTHLAAARVDRGTLPLPFVVEHKLYWCACEGRQEADYLAAILNSGAANTAIKPFQSRGLLGERDIEKKILGLPIPRFDAGAPTHRKLASLGARAAEAASRELPGVAHVKSLGKRRALIREALASILTEVDAIVRTMLSAG